MSPLLFKTLLYAALALCALGLAWRIAAWFRVDVGPEARDILRSQRVAAMFRGATVVLSGRGLFRVLETLLLDVLLVRRLFTIDKLRWLGHLLIVAGFTLLLLMHALAAIVAAQLFQDYKPTLDPYLFLRNLAGAMVLVGMAMVLLGRHRRRTGIAPARGRAGATFVALLGIVLATGFLLEADKIASPQAFYRMADQFVGSTDAQNLKPLRALWASEFGVAFGDLSAPIDLGLAEQGRKLHGEACASCHSKPASAFISYPVSRLLAPGIDRLDDGGAVNWLLYLHVFACFIGLASLPFTRFFHVLANPVSLLVNCAAPARQFSIAGRAARRALALDACVQCGICDTRCSVAPLARWLGNPLLLPSHKLAATGALAGGRLLRAGREVEALRAADGAFLCTDCGRCTGACPVGLDLEDLWAAGRGDLAAAGLPGPAQWLQARPALAWADLLEQGAALDVRPGMDFDSAPLSSDRRSFSRCIQCQTCTNVCPVVAHSIDPEHGVDLTPQKVMNLLRLGLRDLTLGSRMVWDCASCYQCQENCPEGIRVTDIMCELRALAVRRLGSSRSRIEPA